MKFVTVRDFRTHPAQVWQNLQIERELVITQNGKPIGLLTPVSDKNLEGVLKAMRRAHTIQAVEKMRATAHSKGLEHMTLEEINTEIDRARKPC